MWTYGSRSGTTTGLFRTWYATNHPISAESYLTQLRGATLSPNGLVALKSLEESVAACAAWGSEVLAESVTFSWDVMSRVPLQDADGFTNHYQLGYGRDDAPVISVGTEHAYQLLVRNADGTYRDVGLREITIESACALYWLTGSRPDVTLKLNDCPEWHWRRPFSSTWPYHVYAAEYHRVSGGGTWATIGRGVLQAGDTWRRALGDRCYQIELSAYPALQAARGRPPSEERVRFLAEVLSTLRNTARVAIFHGTPKFTERDPRLGLAEVFLGVRTLPSAAVPSHEDEEGLRIYDGGDRRVIFARALNRRNRYVSAEYLASVARLIADVVPGAVGT